MRYEKVKCDFRDCDREIADVYPCIPEFDGWGYVAGVGDVCPHHNYSKFINRNYEPSNQTIDQVVRSIYEPLIKEQLGGGKVFQDYRSEE